MSQLLNSPAALEALVSLRADPRFNVVLADIANYTMEATRRLIYANDRDTMLMVQGSVRGLTELLEAYEKAPGRLNALRERT